MKTLNQIIIWASLSSIFCLYFKPANSQTAEQNLSKYWYLRHRLINSFMVVGPGENMSIPAGISNFSDNGKSNLHFGDASVEQNKKIIALQKQIDAITIQTNFQKSE